MKIEHHVMVREKLKDARNMISRWIDNEMDRSNFGGYDFPASSDTVSAIDKAIEQHEKWYADYCRAMLYDGIADR